MASASALAVAAEAEPKLVIAGNIQSATFQHARLLAQAVPDVATQIVELTELKWTEYLRHKTPSLGRAAASHPWTEPLVYHGYEGYIGGLSQLEDWAKLKHNFEEQKVEDDYQVIADRRFVEYIQATKHVFAWFDLSIGDDKKAHRLLFELYPEYCPKTVENFVTLLGDSHVGSSGRPLTYKGSLLHRIVKNGWIQGGDIVTGQGNSGESIYGPTFGDESFVLKHDQPGALALANNGTPHTNNSQFYITTAPSLEFLDTKRVVFGYVVSGWPTLQRLNELPTLNERPKATVTIVDAGVIDRQGK